MKSQMLSASKKNKQL